MNIKEAFDCALKMSKTGQAKVDSTLFTYTSDLDGLVKTSEMVSVCVDGVRVCGEKTFERAFSVLEKKIGDERKKRVDTLKKELQEAEKALGE